MRQARTWQFSYTERGCPQRSRRGHAVCAPLCSGCVTAGAEARFAQDLHDAFYAEREFTIVDLNGYHLTFAQTLMG